MDAIMLWVKALHVMAVISWMAGLFYLPRLFAYHADTKVGSETSQTFKVMEERLSRIIMAPAMIMTWLTGLLLAWWYGFYLEGWFLAKFVLVLVMSAFHGKCQAWRKAFAADANLNSNGYFRAVNEVPTLLMVVIVILVIVKPF